MSVYTGGNEKDSTKIFTENTYFFNDEKWDNRLENIESRLEKLEMVSAEVGSKN